MKRLLNLIIAARLYLLMVPTALFYAGAGMNQAVLVANGGKFPVMVNDRAIAFFGGEDEHGMMDVVHCRMTDETRLNALADWINLKATVMSPGDLLIALGEYLGQFSTAVWGILVLSDYLRKQK